LKIWKNDDQDWKIEEHLKKKYKVVDNRKLLKSKIKLWKYSKTYSIEKNIYIYIYAYTYIRTISSYTSTETLTEILSKLIMNYNYTRRNLLYDKFISIP